MDTPQRVIDAARLILTTAAARTEQTGHHASQAFGYAEARTAETYQLTTEALAQAARIAVQAAFTAGAYQLAAMASPTTRAAALRKAINHITAQTEDQPCSTRSEPCLPEPQPQSPTRQRNSARSARHLAANVAGLQRFARWALKTPIASTVMRPTVDRPATW